MSSSFKYSYSWSRETVNRFVESYSRGWYNFARILDIPPGELRCKLSEVLASGNSVRWESVKRVIKSLSGYHPDDLKKFSKAESELLYKNLLYLAENDALDVKSDRDTIDSLRQQRLDF